MEQQSWFPVWAHRPWTLAGAALAVIGSVASILGFFGVTSGGVAQALKALVDWPVVGPVSVAINVLQLGIVAIVVDQFLRVRSRLDLIQQLIIGGIGGRPKIPYPETSKPPMWTVNPADFSDISLTNDDLETYHALTRAQVTREFDDAELALIQIWLSPFGQQTRAMQMAFTYYSSWARRIVLVSVDQHGEIWREDSHPRPVKNKEIRPFAGLPWRHYPGWKDFLRRVRQVALPLSRTLDSHVVLHSGGWYVNCWVADCHDGSTGEAHRWTVDEAGNIQGR